jgi:hypothetical protein
MRKKLSEEPCELDCDSKKAVEDAYFVFIARNLEPFSGLLESDDRYICEFDLVGGLEYWHACCARLVLKFSWEFLWWRVS